MNKKTMYENMIKEDNKGKYYLVESDREVIPTGELTRLQAYRILVNCGCVNELAVWRTGIENFVNYIDRVLDGSLTLSKYKFYRVSNMTDSLEEQMKYERDKVWRKKNENN